MQFLSPRPQIQTGQIVPAAPAAPAPPVITGYATSLKLNPQRKEWLIDYITTRVNEVKREMGFDQADSLSPENWMAIRIRNENSYDNNLEWRKQISGTIFSEGHNFTLGTNRRYARLISARVRDDLLGTRPCFGAMTKDAGDPELTAEVERYIQDKITDSNVMNALRDALRIAMIRNEAVVKTTYRKEETPFYGPAKVMVDQWGKPTKTPLTEEYIYENDEFIPDPTTQGMVSLKKDPSFSMQKNQYGFQQFASLPQKLVKYDAPDCRVLDTRDFLCPLKVASVHDADINVHLFLENPNKLKGSYAGYDVADQYYRSRADSTGVKQPRRTQGEEEERASSVLGTVLMGEIYLKADVDEDGEEEEVMVVFDFDQGDIVFADYTGNHMSRRPFDVIVGIERVPDRWYGVGVFSKMEHNALYIDAQLNRINEKDSQDSSLTFYKKNAVRQWKDGAIPAPGSRQMLEVLDGFDATHNPPAWRTNLQSEAVLGMELLQIMRQSGDQEFGVISASDASASNLNQSKTATGVMSIDRDASVMTKDTEYEHILGIEGVLDLATELLLENMPQAQLRFSPDFQSLVALDRDEIRSLDRKVKLLLTKTRSTQQLQMGEKAEAVWLRYMRLSPPEQMRGRPLYVMQLKGLEVDDVDDLLPKVTPQDVQAYQKQQAAAAQQGEQKPVSTSIVTKYSDLARSEQEQLLMHENIKPAAKAEVDAKEQQTQEDKLQLKETAPPRPKTASS